MELLDRVEHVGACFGQGQVPAGAAFALELAEEAFGRRISPQCPTSLMPPTMGVVGQQLLYSALLHLN